MNISQALFAAGLLLVSAASEAADEINFRLSAADARKIHMLAADKYVGEFGDVNGPFKDVGSIVIASPGLKELEVRADGSLAGYGPGIDDPGTLLHIEFFVNEKGNGFGVVHKRPLAPAAKEKTVEPTEDNRPSDHVELCGAAKLAITNGNTELLKALLQAGLLINEPLDLEYSQTALHIAIIYNDARMVKMLLENGADPDARDKWHKRPIDQAFEGGHGGLCGILAKPETEDRMLGGFPEPALDELFNTPSNHGDQTIFLQINGEDPDKELLGYFRRHWRDVRPASTMEEVPKEKGKTAYRDAKTKDHGMLVQIRITKAENNTFDWSKREANGPALAGGGIQGKVSKKYGYWLLHDKSSWDE